MISRAVELGLDRAGRLLWHLRLGPWLIRRGRRNPKVLLYHACEPVETPFIRDLGVNTPPPVFAAQLDFLARYYDVLPVEQVAGSGGTGGVADRSGRPRVAVTFDDGYRSVLTHGAPLLAARQLPATVYLVTDVVGNDDLVWVNELNWLLVEHPGPTGPVVARALGLPAGSGTAAVVADVLGRYRPELVRSLLADLWAAVPVARAAVIEELDLYLTWDEVRAMTGSGFGFGSHTATHPNLRGLGPEEVADELDRATDAMQRELGECATFAYPFGFTDDEVTAAVESRDFSSVMIVGGTNHGAKSLRTARLALEGTSPAVLFAQLEVVSPGKAWLRSVAARVRGRRAA